MSHHPHRQHPSTRRGRRGRALAGAAAVAVVTQAPAATPSDAPATGDDADDGRGRAYGQVLDTLRPDQFETSKTDSLTGEYEYALADADEDGKPELVVRQLARAKGTTEESPVKVFGYDARRRTALEARRTVYDGAESVGFMRYAVTGTRDGSGLVYSKWNGGDGQTTSVVVRFTGTDLEDAPGRVWDYRIDRSPADLEALKVPLQWTPSGDRGPLTGSGGPTSGEQAAPPAGQAAPPAAGAASTDGRSKADFPYYTVGQTGTAPASSPNRTSPEFGRAVYDAFIDAWTRTGDDEPVLSVTSPVTGTAYTMTCSYAGSGGLSVLCSGGQDAKVYIYRPIPDSVTKPNHLQQG
ncbi:hypothetical protein MTQ16_04395 [Corynebacterium bovis]|uniref:hypothetical protein n=1 Tax=Corynebacterium bovis TaxID=36808 RepID=UPI003139FD98